MNSLLPDLTIGITVFVATNIDDLFLLAAFFANPQVQQRSIVAGQFLGIGILTLASALAAYFALALPEGWVALLGLAPLLLGVRALLALRTDDAADDENDAQRNLQADGPGWGVQAMAVASVTIANGGDNIGVYVPLFTNASVNAIVIYTFVFAVLTGVWCVLGRALVSHPVLGGAIKR